jgi:hypothetical protein
MRGSGWLFAFGLGCGAVDEVASCAETPVEACAADARCAVIEGRAYTWDDAAACYDTGVPTAAGCMDRDSGCNDRVTYAKASESSDCTFFSSQCVPSGWIDCEDELLGPPCR